MQIFCFDKTSVSPRKTQKWTIILITPNQALMHVARAAALQLDGHLWYPRAKSTGQSKYNSKYNSKCGQVYEYSPLKLKMLEKTSNLNCHRDHFLVHRLSNQ